MGGVQLTLGCGLAHGIGITYEAGGNGGATNMKNEMLKTWAGRQKHGISSWLQGLRTIWASWDSYLRLETDGSKDSKKFLADYHLSKRFDSRNARAFSWWLLQ